ncbi:hypothetical protein P7K49_031458 [Saguinus oedipus]|uniref:Uncharacterized protein n=1 Tax=Saguinus oedipus TaxID=9490 RepID=A0ABQ9U1C4_SAGOE|nr:hypothetical protein P7K49_031458 [Saguinus oedipus]
MQAHRELRPPPTLKLTRDPEEAKGSRARRTGRQKGGPASLGISHSDLQQWWRWLQQLSRSSRGCHEVELEESPRATGRLAQPNSGSELVLSEDEKSDNEDKEETELGVMEDQRSVILHLISQLKLGMDLTKLVPEGNLVGDPNLIATGRSGTNSSWC